MRWKLTQSKRTLSLLL